MVSEYYYDDVHGEDASDSNSDDDSNEPLDYQDWSTIYNQELWDMWYGMKEYLDNRYTYENVNLFEKVQPDDFFHEFCFEYPPHFHQTDEFKDWEKENKSDLNYLWKMIKDNTKVFGNKIGNKTYTDFCIFLYNSKKSKPIIYNEFNNSRHNLSQGGYSSGSIFSVDPWVHHFY